ncbi:MAG: WGxxGxxG-CTERM domain-containing protein [Calothrix sp. SM1_7_51]|nr:WGxxGxxG-CTERM domain-containing protein [Calothrix sp. SM1_7_51]
MKKSTILSPLKATFLTISLAFLASTFPAVAQTNTTTPDTNRTVETTREYRDNDFNWGWLGLTGLLGLLGLTRKREEPTRYSDPNVTTRSGTNY